MKVCIKETLEKVVEVDSIEVVELMYNRSEIILDAEDLKTVEFIKLEE